MNGLDEIKKQLETMANIYNFGKKTGYVLIKVNFVSGNIQNYQPETKETKFINNEKTEN